MKKYLRRIPMNLLIAPIVLPLLPFLIGYLIGSKI